MCPYETVALISSWSKQKYNSRTEVVKSAIKLGFLYTANEGLEQKPPGHKPPDKSPGQKPP